MKRILIDECHLVNPKQGMYEQFFNSIPEVPIMGYTATPYRLSNDTYGGAMLKFLTRTRPKVFDKVVYVVQNGALFAQGYLAKLDYKNIPFDRARLKLNSTGADYDDDSVRRHLDQTGYQDRIVRVVNRLMEIGRRNALVFTRFVEESEYVVSKIPGAEIVTAKSTPANRARIGAAFKAGEIKVVCNVGIYTTGFDHPQLESVVLARPTRSLALYYQMVGRAIRPHPDKTHSTIVDMAALVQEFGKVEDLILTELPGKRGGEWALFSGRKQLTNVYFGEGKGVKTRRYFIKKHSNR